MIITTTAAIEGFRVVRHIGPISVHMVAGTSGFSDFFASVTDVFGGVSGTYGRQLSTLYTRATKLLEEEARRKGANAVLGLSIDFDELSGQGKSMFMLNALGTAVRVAEAGRTDAPSAGRMDAETVARALQRRALVRELVKGGVSVSDEMWEFATSERIEEFTRYVVSAVARTEEHPGTRNGEIEKAGRYFAALGPDIAAHRLFPYLSAENLPDKTRNAAAVLIRHLALMDYDLLLESLDSPDVETARRGLQIATAPRHEYTIDDMERIRAVRRRLHTRFEPRWQSTKIKGVFGREHAAWSCPCGGNPALDETYCPKCLRDNLGLAVRDIGPGQVDEYLEELLEVLAPAVENV